MAYVIDGNLYFQDGSKPPIQLTDSGKDRQPVFTADGKGIVFYRGEQLEEVHSINIDGTQEKVLIASRLLMALDTSYTESTYVHSLTVIPGTHLMLFGTQESQSSMPRWNNDLLMVDADTAEIKRILPPGHVSTFYVSPDGRFIAVDTIGAIDIIDLDGKIVHKSLLTYTPSEPVFLPPGIFWMPDSVGLVVLLPIPTSYESDYPPDYTVWRYMLDGSTIKEILLDPLPMEHSMAEVSPDGNWVIYNREDQYDLYIGDLRTGHTKLYDPQLSVSHYDWGWSPDNEHFVYSLSNIVLYLGSVDAPPQLIGNGEFQGWIDSNRYLYYDDKNIIMGDIMGSKEIILADHESFRNRGIIFTYVFVNEGN